MSLTLIILISLLKIGMADTEPCNTNLFIDNYKRSTKYRSSGDWICDSELKEDWYRITSGAGELMPTECPPFGEICGTVYPIYLENVTEVFPEDGTEVERTAYALIDYNCKAKELSIRIKNCTEYLVYYLKPTIGCDSGYCFGSELPCNLSESHPTRFTPNCSPEFPDITLYPKIKVENTKTYRFKNSHNFTYILPEFKCTADNATSEYAYDISFYINDVEMSDAKYVNISYDKLSTASLQQNHWENTFRLNMLVKCSMQARYRYRGVPSEKYFSSDFFAGIKVREDFENGVWIKEGETKTIFLTATYPIGCSYVYESKAEFCYVALYNGVPDYQKDKCKDGINENNVQFTAADCKRVIYHSNWTEDQPIVITGKANDIVDREVRVVSLRLYTPPTSYNIKHELGVWINLTLPDIKVYIEDTDLERYGSACLSNNDPHMRNFDGVYWELQGRRMKGEYVLYKHDNSPQQVNAYYTPCYSRHNALCNCGIAIRSSTSVFIANFCSTGSQSDRKYNRYVVSRECNDQHMVVTEIGNSGYTATLPTGTIVTFSHGAVNFPGDDPFYGIHSISITPSTLDFGLTDGLCGIYNNVNVDDFRSNDKEESAKQWRVVNATESFFRADGVLPDVQYTVQAYCTCKKKSENNSPPEYNCESTDKLQNCSKHSTTTVYHTSCISSAHSRSKRGVKDISSNDNNDEPAMFDMINYDEDDNITVMDSGEWKNGLTEVIANAKCESHIKSLPAFSVCTTYVPILDFESSINDCIADMKMTGSDDFLTITIQNFESQCMSTALKMENLTDSNTTNSNGESKNIFEVISESTCTNNCSERGSCIKGNCECYKGYHGRDCSKDNDEPPRVMKKAFEKNCDNKIKRCEKVAVPGIDFATTNLTCKLRKFTVSANNSQILEDDGSTVAGIYSSSFLMYCPVPNSRRRRSVDDDTIATGYFISVSNNGQAFSEELTLMIYDGSCFECDSSSLTCGKLDTCPFDPVTKEPDSQNLGIVIGISCAFVALCVVATVCLKKNIFVKRKPYISDSFVSLKDKTAKGW